VSRGAGVGLVPFLFGAADREELPGTALVRLLVDVGSTPGAARSLIARMRRDGYLEATPRGRGADYRLAGFFLESFRQIRDGRPQPPVWDGFFHAIFYTVPESQRAYRDLLRRAAQLAGYGLMQPGVLISTSDRRERLTAELGEAPRAGTVYFGRVELAIGDAAAIAYRAWELEELGRRYREHAERLRAAIREQPVPPPPSAAALASYVGLFGGALIDTLRTPPALPPELLPEDWSLPVLLAAIGQTYAHFGPPVMEYISGVLAEHGA
jgi:phenylacetic acid degradation operon negative regulatory protein